MSALKICIFTETYYPVIGGGETQARLLAEGLVANGFSVILLTRRSDPSLKKIEQFGEVTVYRLPPVGRGQLKKWGLLLSSVPLLIKLQRKYDLIFVSGFRIVGIAAVLVSKLFGKACVLKADSQGEMSGEFFRDGLVKVGASPSGWPFKLFLRVRNLILKRADAFTAITSDIVTELTTVGVPPATIQMIPNSVDTTRFCPVNDRRKADLRDKLGLPQAGKIAVYTGRLVSYKGLPLLLRVWQAIQDQHPEAYLVLVGTGGLDIHNCEAELKAYVEANGLQHSVHFTGSVHALRVPEYLQAADLFVFPTENDAFPSSLVEAMTCRLPVITTPVGAIKTIVTDQKNGLLVQPGDFQQLREAIETLLTQPELAARLGQAGWQTVQDNYSAEIVTQKYINVFRQVVNTAEVINLPVDYS
jgi:glycosyltransferase involved in cell wall biosynthesis